MDLFEEICNTRWFRDTAMILCAAVRAVEKIFRRRFLNKRDLLQEKLQRGARLSNTFPDYTGGQSYEVRCRSHDRRIAQAAVEFISDKFQSLNKFKDVCVFYIVDHA